MTCSRLGVAALWLCFDWRRGRLTGLLRGLPMNLDNRVPARRLPGRYGCLAAGVRRGRRVAPIEAELVENANDRTINGLRRRIASLAAWSVGKPADQLKIDDTRISCLILVLLVLKKLLQTPQLVDESRLLLADVPRVDSFAAFGRLSLERGRRVSHGATPAAGRQGLPICRVTPEPRAAD